MLADLPSDIVLLILCMTCVEDVLSIERTCSRLRDIIAMRHHWLKQLQLLSQACAPDLPPHVDVSTLSGPQLRTLVVNAVASYQNCRKGRIGGPNSRITTILYKDGIKDARFDLYGGHAWLKKLVSGGRYLLLQLPCIALILIDLARDNHVVWSYQKPQSIYDPGTERRKIIKSDIQVGRDGSMQIVTLTVSTVEWKQYADIFELTPSPDHKSNYECTTRFSAFLEHEFGYFDIRIEGDYVAGADPFALLICNWVEQWCIHIDLNEEVTVTHNSPIIRNEHLIYLSSGQGGYYSLNAIDLRNITNKHGRRVGINEIDRSRLSVVALLPDDIESYFVDDMSLCSFTWTTWGPKELLTVLIHEYRDEDLYFTAIEFIFDPQESSLSKLRRHRSTEPFKCPLQISFSAPPADLCNEVQVLDSSQCARWLVKLDICSPFNEGPEADLLEDGMDPDDSKTIGLVYLGLDERGELFHSPVPELTAMIELGDGLETENYSGALVCNHTWETIIIIYPHA